MAQVAIDPQSSMVLSHGLADGGQQSCIGSTAEISVALSLNSNRPSIGSIAADTAIRNANMDRVINILQRGELFQRRSASLPMNRQTSRL